MSKIRMSDEDLKTYGIITQKDLDRFQKKVNEQMGTAVEYEPLPDPISPEVRVYLEAKGLTPNANNSIHQNTPTESVISVEDINQFNKLKNK